jgi:hypothetical protein
MSTASAVAKATVNPAASAGLVVLGLIPAK